MKHLVRSQTDSNIIYKVEFFQGGYMTCSCTNYEMKNAYTRPPFNIDCKHCKFIRQKFYARKN